jgi:hypothetical protein
MSGKIALHFPSLGVYQRISALRNSIQVLHEFI